jgi:hypothetical protein
MAYSKRRTRRYTRKRGSTRRGKKFGRRYRYGKSKRRGGIRKRGRNWISPYQKKRDTVRAAHSTQSDNAWAPIGTPNTIFGFSPTWRDRTQITSSDNPTIERRSRHVGYSGYKERVLIATSSPLIWRRIVIWSYIQVDSLAPPLKKDAAGNKYYTRNVTPLQLGPTLRNWLFRGTKGVDYTTDSVHEAPLNTDNFTIQSDTTRIINPTSNVVSQGFGTIREKKFWQPGGKIIYDDDEAGSQVSRSSGWSVPSFPSKGNMYIFDLFTDGMAHTADQGNVARFLPQGIHYWVEG